MNIRRRARTLQKGDDPWLWVPTGNVGELCWVVETRRDHDRERNWAEKPGAGVGRRQWKKGGVQVPCIGAAVKYTDELVAGLGFTVRIG